MHLLARCIAVVAALQYAKAAELLFAPEKLASSGQLTLSLDEVDFGNNYTGVITRGFDGGLPGPTFRMNPGETLSIGLRNNLNADNSKTCTETQTEFCETSISNLHTHGLHVSPNGIEDGLDKHSDNIFAVVNPGETGQFSYEIPDYHMPGTHWYHPHHHHATAMQAGGGAAGVLIVNDPAGYLPAEYEDMTEKILFISGHNLVTLADMADKSDSTLLANAVTQANLLGLDTNVFLTNGQKDATMSIASHQWYRFRMIYAAVEQSLELSIDASDDGFGAVCQWKLLAKDGIYLEEIPRDINNVMLFPGARADVAVSCTCTTYPCTATLGSAAAARRSGSRTILQGPGGGGAGAGPGAAGADVVEVTVLTLTISETADGTTITLPTTTLQRPCYLVNLQNVQNPPTGSLKLNGGGKNVQWDDFGESMTYANSHPTSGTFKNSAGQQQATWPSIATFTAGTVQEMVVTGAAAHPLHIHVNPFQITQMPADSYNDNYFRVGDWHDTLMISEMTGSMTVRTQLDVFTGKTVVHCHILEHEDEGMMSWFDIEGTEGATYADAKTIDPTCYDTTAMTYAAFNSGSSEPAATTSSEPTSSEPIATTSSEPTSSEPIATTSSEPTSSEPIATTSSEPTSSEPIATTSSEPTSSEPIATTSSVPTAAPNSAGSTCAETKAAYKSSSCCNQADVNFANYTQCVGYKATYQSSECCRRRRTVPSPQNGPPPPQ